MSALLRLVRVELRRLLHRRAVLVLSLAAVLIPVVIGVGIALDTRPPSAAEVAEAERLVEQDRQQPGLQDEIDDCVEDPDAWGILADSPEAVEAECREQLEPQLDWYLWHSELDLAQERDAGSGVVVTVVLALLLTLVGTTFTGYDWASGSVSNQLLFEPRRARVWLAKALVVTGFGLVLAAVVLTSYWLALGAVARSRDLPGGGALLLDCLQMGWRGAGIAAVAALLGLALTMLFRSTVATLGILFAVTLFGSAVLGILGFEGRWNPAINLHAVLEDGSSYQVEVPCTPVAGETPMEGELCFEERAVTLAQGAGYLGGVVAVACGTSVLWFRRRDVP